MTEADRLRLRGRLKLAEGFRRSAYVDSKGFLTIGYGRLIDERRGGGLSEDEAEYLLANDLRRAERDADTLDVYETLSPARQAVLIEMCFNLGVGGVKKFTRMLAALREQDYKHAAAEMLDSQWTVDVKGRALVLAEQMKTGQWP